MLDHETLKEFFSLFPSLTAVFWLTIPYYFVWVLFTTVPISFAHALLFIKRDRLREELIRRYEDRKD